VSPLLAHGIGGVSDLPVPQWLFYYGGAVVLVVSFLALAALWRRPRLEHAGPGRPLPGRISRIVLSSPVRIALAALSLSLLVLVGLAGLLGEQSPTENIAPTFVYVLFWLGLVPVVVLLGNVWPALNPWRAAADGVASLWRRSGRTWEVGAYPARWGRWPATLLLLGFVALELAYPEPANPRALALAVYLYSAATWLGMLAFGRAAWLQNGEAFSVYFGFLSRLSPFGVEEAAGERRIVVRVPLTGMKIAEGCPGTLAFVAVMLGSVAFDGFSRTTWWQERRYSAVEPFLGDSPALADAVGGVVNFAGLIAAIAFVALAYVAAVRSAGALTRTDLDLAETFLASLVPIALVYAVAHYFSLLVLQGQFVVPLASDPLGRGWDLFGTAAFQPDLGVLSPNAVWYTQVGALVVGHVAGLVLAHDRAVALFRSGAAALLAQYPLLVLMVVYTVGGLWLLSAG
jgi:hypothetical protein